MKHIALGLMLVSFSVFAATHNEDGSVLLSPEEVQETIRAFHDMQEKIALDGLKIKEMTQELILLRNAKCL